MNNMKLFKKLNNLSEPFDAVIGLGVGRAKNYEKDKMGYLLMFRFNYKDINITKKLFIRTQIYA